MVSSHIYFENMRAFAFPLMDRRTDLYFYRFSVDLRTESPHPATTEQPCFLSNSHHHHDHLISSSSNAWLPLFHLCQVASVAGIAAEGTHLMVNRNRPFWKPKQNNENADLGWLIKMISSSLLHERMTVVKFNNSHGVKNLKQTSSDDNDDNNESFLPYCNAPATWQVLSHESFLGSKRIVMDMVNYVAVQVTASFCCWMTNRKQSSGKHTQNETLGSKILSCDACTSCTFHKNHHTCVMILHIITMAGQYILCTQVITTAHLQHANQPIRMCKQPHYIE